VDRHAPGLGLGNGDLLQGVLQVGAGRFQLLDQVGTVQQLEGRGVVTRQPAFQQPADAVAGVGGVEVGRAGRTADRGPPDLLLGLAAVDLPLVKIEIDLYSRLSGSRVSLLTRTATARPCSSASSAVCRAWVRTSVAMSSVHCAPTLRRTNSS
jgi:hypothetical protein